MTVRGQPADTLSAHVAIVPPTPGLCIGETLTLPVEVVTRTMAILGVKGAGKTHAAVVVAEEAIRAHVPVLVIDPLGAWYGLRSSPDGSSPGLPVVVFGGRHGDLPLDPEMGTALADLLVEEPIAAILDLTLLRRSQQIHLLSAFCRQLFDRTIERSETHPQPRLLIVDEADLFAPQRQLRRSADHQALHEALDDIVRRARKGGLGTVLLSQRNAALDKDLLSQAEILFVLRSIEPNDVDAVDEWIRRRVSAAQRTELLSSLAALANGEAWVALSGELTAAGETEPSVRRVRIRERATFDSSRTPVVGVSAPVVVHPPPTIDLAYLQERLTALTAPGDQPSGEATDRHLLARIAEVECSGALREARTGRPPHVEPIVDYAQARRLLAWWTELREPRTYARLTSADRAAMAALNPPALPGAPGVWQWEDATWEASCPPAGGTSVVTVSQAVPVGQLFSLPTSIATVRLLAQIVLAGRIAGETAEDTP